MRPFAARIICRQCCCYTLCLLVYKAHCLKVESIIFSYASLSHNFYLCLWQTRPASATNRSTVSRHVRLPSSNLCLLTFHSSLSFSVAVNREKRGDHLAFSCLFFVSLLTRMANRNNSMKRERWGGQWCSGAVALSPSRQPARSSSIGSPLPRCEINGRTAVQLLVQKQTESERRKKASTMCVCVYVCACVRVLTRGRPFTSAFFLSLFLFLCELKAERKQ